MALTTGFASSTTAGEITAALQTELGAGYTVTRGVLWDLPALPAVVLLGPAIATLPLGFNTEEARYRWLIVVMRGVVDNDRRAEELDTLGDAIMTKLYDLFRTSATFTYQHGDGPERLGDEQLVELVERNPRIDALAIVCHTRTEINPPCP